MTTQRPHVIDPAILPVQWALRVAAWGQIHCSLGSLGAKGPMGSVGHMGQMRPMGPTGSVGHMGPMERRRTDGGRVEHRNFNRDNNIGQRCNPRRLMWLRGPIPQ